MLQGNRLRAPLVIRHRRAGFALLRFALREELLPLGHAVRPGRGEQLLADGLEGVIVAPLRFLDGEVELRQLRAKQQDGTVVRHGPIEHGRVEFGDEVRRERLRVGDVVEPDGVAPNSRISTWQRMRAVRSSVP